MTQFVLTKTLKKVLEASVPPEELVELLKNNDGYLSHKDLIRFYHKFKPTSSLLDLIKLSQIHLPNKNVVESKPKTKEYLQLMERLRLNAKETEYRKLVTARADYDTLYEDKSHEVQTPAQMNKEIKNYLTTIVNILISVASVVYAIWYWTASSWALPDSYRVLMCLFFGLLVLVAEVVVYLGYLNKIDTARTVERKKKEVKKVLKTL
ncbi:Vacuolar ATPase assembly integral membrane protein [Yamadazyma tenuis]|uniref:Vacuolar ATPase assembly integral membrane protein VPH2 n=1 Tax=Candida tenuis (strain ATCC 10573 / BCRC 21748 / CBS 615 / JCM 9827 / NBRC 10315 / NRRL Y-1498 / VKM Y-70) TaxID=590646 RepID=G3B2N6_CANTC|nr:uncharacterized protein CANTEDRAFT_97576 [Yamadazyma tenuis ATCC 10573]EGV64724.1 hypothetical protein CANTEDRAFT_97576 [Yamadazyma tenuis ATCC 10573]WEJ97511.1 Vacuolar ATPase assembly integral membrane protein [Yamadazyma tenuis]